MANLYRIRNDVYGTDPDHADDLDLVVTHELTAVVAYLEHLVVNIWHTDLVFTSIYRPDDPGSTHHDGRAVDVRIYKPERGIEWDSAGCGLDIDDAHEIADLINATFGPWKGSDGKLHQTAIIHGEGLHEHIHIQVPARAWV